MIGYMQNHVITVDKAEANSFIYYFFHEIRCSSNTLSIASRFNQRLHIRSLFPDPE